jgi:hypothetical protein
MKQMTPHGAFGEPSLATAEKGCQITAIVCNVLVRILTDLATP